MARKLFCDLCPLTYELSRWKGIAFRHLQDLRCSSPFARSRREEPLPVLAYRHASLVGATSARKGYREGLMIKRGQPSQGIGGGLCQFTNLLHWLVLHSPLRIVEYHHHDGVDLFPDCGRQIPFGIGTSISYNYLDYRFQNPTGTTFQLLVWTTDTHLCGELRADADLPLSWHIRSEEETFVREGDRVYRNNVIVRECVDKRSGNLLSRETLKRNHALVLYEVPEDRIMEEI